MTAAFDNALKSSNPRVGIFFRLDLDEPFRMWLGVGDCEAGIDATDGDGEVYRGCGEMLNVPMFQQLLNATAERVAFTLSGVSQRVAQMAASESDDIKGISLRVGLGAFGEDWALIDTPIWLRRFIVDYMTLSQEQSGTNAAVYTVALSTRTIFTGRRRPGLSFFTDEEQQRRSTGDRFCRHVMRYTQIESKAWPRP